MQWCLKEPLHITITLTVDDTPQFDDRIDSAERGDPGSKTILIRFQHPLKQFSESVSIDEGRQID
jgi:hypothetical protein